MGIPRRGGAPALEPLTPREEEVLALIAEGCTNTEIADRLGIRFDTAKNHVHNILQKLDAPSREEAARWWRGQRSPARVHRWLSAIAWPSLWRSLGTVAAVAAAVIVVAAITAATIVALRNGASDASEQTAPAERPTPSATNPGDDPNSSDLTGGLPEGAVGPLLVYIADSTPPNAIPGSYPLRVYDVGQRRVIAELDAPSQTIGGVVLGDGILIAEPRIGGNRLTLLRLDGTRDVLYTPAAGYRTLSMALSPDNRFVAMLESIAPAESPSRLMVLPVDIEGPVPRLGDPVLQLDLTRGDLGDFAGVARSVQWLPAGSGLIVHGYSETADPPGHAVIALDGSVRFVWNGNVESSPHSRYAITGLSPTGCRSHSAPMLEAVELLAAEPTRSIEYDGRLLDPLEWSSDGSTVLVNAYAPASPGPEPGAVCPYENTGEPQLLVWDIGAGTITPSTRSIMEWRQEWYGDRALWFQCGDTIEPGGPLPFRDTLLGACEQGQPVALVRDAIPVDEADSAIVVLGWIDAP